MPKALQRMFIIIYTTYLALAIKHHYFIPVYCVKEIS